MRRSKSKSGESSIRSLLLTGSAQYPRKVPGSTVAGGLLHLSYLCSHLARGKSFGRGASQSIRGRLCLPCLSYLGHCGIQGGNDHKSLFSNVSRCFSCLCQLLQISKTLKRVLEDSLLGDQRKRSGERGKCTSQEHLQEGQCFPVCPWFHINIPITVTAPGSQATDLLIEL